MFTGETLYSFIDGAADVYLTFDFDHLLVDYYRRGDTSVTVEVYAFKSDRDAYGMYSLERTPTVEFLPIGIQGYHAETVLNFVLGRTYVKCTAFELGKEERRILSLVAETMAKRLGGTVKAPRLFSCFPAQGLVQNSQRFIAQNFLGYRFLHSGYIADYRADTAAFQLFIIEAADSSDCHAMWEQYSARTMNAVLDSASGSTSVTDRYQGVVSLVRSGTAILGMIGQPPRGKAGDALRSLGLCMQSSSTSSGHDNDHH